MTSEFWCFSLSSPFPKAGLDDTMEYRFIFSFFVRKEFCDGYIWGRGVKGAGGGAAGTCQPVCGRTGGEVAETLRGPVGAQGSAGLGDRGAIGAESQRQVHRGRRGDARACGLGQGEQAVCAGEVWGAAGAGGGASEGTGAVCAGFVLRGGCGLPAADSGDQRVCVARAVCAGSVCAAGSGGACQACAGVYSGGGAGV